MPSKTKKPTSFHWGSYYAEVENEKIVSMRPYENDKDPSKIANGIINSIDDELRIRVPHVRKGYLKEIPINSDQSYFDTNTSHHHHFYDENQKDLIDLDDADVEPVNINAKIPGKKIKSVEVLVKVEDINS